MDLQNKNNILVAKQVSYRIFVPMPYISFQEMDKNVSEYNNEYVSEYSSKYVSEYTSECISEYTSA